jgi:4-hydroxy-tetrahydrodipicolinate reductase
MEDYCNQQNGAFFYASNYSIGVNIFFKLNQYLAKLMKAYPEYGPSIEETHHIHKKDAPSGTAITLAEAVVQTLPNIKEWVLSEQNAGKLSENALPITALRKDEIPGTHIVSYASEIDDIKISHTAHTRKGFALGAVLVAEWIRNKKGVLHMDDFLQF